MNTGPSAQPGPARLLRGVRDDKAVMLAVLSLTVVVAAAVAAPWVAPFDPTAIDLRNTNLPPMLLVEDRLHVLGTDHLGRDLFSRLIFGARISVAIGLATVCLAGSVGVVLGLSAGFFRGALDDILMRLVDLQLGFPPLLIALTVLLVSGGGLINIVVTLSLVRWALYARVSRALALSLSQQSFVEAARSIGCSNQRLIFRHVLPNAWTALVSVSSLEVARMMLAEASLSFLGLGIQPPDMSWGSILGGARAYIEVAWWPMVFPGLAIMATTFNINVTAHWIRESAHRSIADFD